VLFGGVTTGGVFLNDTWEWDGQDWIQADPQQIPPRRGYIAMAFHATRGRIVLFSGWNGGLLADTWEWDGINWSKRTPVLSAPSRYYNGLAYDAVNGEIVLFGGYAGASFADTWTYSYASPTAQREGCRLAEDADGDG